MMLFFGCIHLKSESGFRELPKSVAFKEVWGCFMQGCETKLTGAEQVTDLCYFSASINYKAELTGPGKLPVVATTRPVRKHLVITELSNPSLTHFCLNPALAYREKLISDIIEFLKEYDGIQIDFESVKTRDKENFLQFLKDLKNRMNPEKILSVAVPARYKDLGDAYDYSAVSAAADRVIVMAYDQHWSASSPGPVASLEWCSRVAVYAKSKVDPSKLIMGIPLYSRSWQDKKLARAFGMNTLSEIKKNLNPDIKTGNGADVYFTYKENVTVTVYFDDIRTIVQKVSLYSQQGVRGISFWRMGLEDQELWSYIVVP